MPLYKTISLRTHIYDLDSNRHVTSRTYERFSYEARFSLLADLGFSVHSCLEKKIEYVSGSTFVRFLSQQFADSLLNVETELSRDNKDLLHFKHTLIDQKEIKVCEILTTAYLQTKTGERVMPKEIPLLEDSWKKTQIHERKSNQNALKHNISIPYSDMGCFWNLPSESVWKIFEEGRFLFFKEVIDLNFIKEADFTTFFMGGEIQIYSLPKPGTNIILQSWIQSIEKIRFYFRQDILDEEGKLLASMRDEQLFVTLSTSRPRRSPAEFIACVERFTQV